MAEEEVGDTSKINREVGCEDVEWTG